VDGKSLSIAEVAAVARHGASVSLTSSRSVRDAVASSRHVIESKMEEGKSVYGVSTGFGGSGELLSSSP
jgi:phenylalanine ammonia-lyase